MTAPSGVSALRIRTTYLAGARAARELMASETVAAGWEQPSALRGWRVSGLTGHLARAITTVGSYLDADPPDDSVPRASAAEYIVRAVPDNDLSSDLHAGIRARGDEVAAGGHHALVQKVDELLTALQTRLASEPHERVLSVFDGLALELDEYLKTRIVELVVHCDDLAVSVGGEVQVPHDALRVANVVLLDVAALRHGDVEVLRALARRERARPGSFHAY